MSTAIRILSALTTGIAVSALTAGTATADGGAIPLNDEQEAPGAVSDGSGFFSYTTSSTELCYTLEVSNLSGSPFAVTSIHLAPRHSPRPVVVPLAALPAASGSVSHHPGRGWRNDPGRSRRHHCRPEGPLRQRAHSDVARR